ncbi:MAG TPA: division/cell wall cluster transcriptional repressor MraZ [Gaiellaceae bacterium]|nr:division/cell wall cluster transcriptional repressor MraZ [Gaiellaceae bacterium]
MLLGEFEHTIDDKNRLTLPAKFRQALSGGLVITRGLDPCLLCYPEADWERLVETRLAQLDPFSREGRMMHRFFFAGASEAAPDKQGRVALPATLAKDLGREVVVAGVRDHLEIWNREAWRDHVKVMEGSAEDVAERLATQRD